ncbi:hypothetical protein [Bacillus sp. MUM 13]|uniref:hypothetical protein n=1 Tax=Bacillus sp. MUM 13 TaxID=1678001 RepID=UPI0008F5F6A2|nr:hypothetical protein [Bacillus sp. MUM 13]OIK11620.1 hypothetical protein BIV59_11295 [Bacillus sp. MUM 13]
MKRKLLGMCMMFLIAAGGCSQNKGIDDNDRGKQNVPNDVNYPSQVPNRTPIDTQRQIEMNIPPSPANE